MSDLIGDKFKRVHPLVLVAGGNAFHLPEQYRRVSLPGLKGPFFAVLYEKGWTIIEGRTGWVVGPRDGKKRPIKAASDREALDAAISYLRTAKITQKRLESRVAGVVRALRHNPVWDGHDWTQRPINERWPE